MAEKPNIPNSDTNRNFEPFTHRATHMRRDDDTFQTPKITIYDVDYAILFWLSQHLQLQVQENKRIIDVPVLFANGETWSQIRQHGYMRDVENKIMTPLISIRRVSMVEDDRLPKLDGNNISSNVRFSMYPYKNMNNIHDQLGELYNTKQSNTYYLVALPEYYRVSYELLLWTTTQEQLNDIVHEIIVTNRHSWGDTMKFTTMVQDISFETLKTPGEDRLIRATIPLEVSAILIKEFEGRDSTLQKAYSIKRVRFENERSQPDFILYDENTGEPRTYAIEPEKDVRKTGKRNVRYPQNTETDTGRFDL